MLKLIIILLAILFVWLFITAKREKCSKCGGEIDSYYNPIVHRNIYYCKSCGEEYFYL